MNQNACHVGAEANENKFAIVVYPPHHFTRCSSVIDIALRALAVVAIVSAHGLFAHADDLCSDYLRDVRPILAANCFACHGPDAASRDGGLRLDQSDAAQQQLESGVY